MEIKTILFLILSSLIIIFYPVILEKINGPTPHLPVPQNLPQTQNAPPIVSGGLPIHPATDESASSPAVTVIKKEKVIETDLYKMVLSNIGGAIVHFELKKYTQKNKDGISKPIDLVSPHGTIHPLALVDELGKEINIPFQMDETPLILTASRPEGSLELISLDPDGKKMKKLFRFRNNDYLIDLAIQTEGEHRYRLSTGTNFGIDHWDAGLMGSIGAVSLIQQETLKEEPGKTEVITQQGSPTWFAIQGKYFISAIIPKTVNQMGPVFVRKEGLQAISSEVGIGTGRTDFQIYAGPKEFDRLTALHVQLEESIDFGWFLWGSWLPVRMVAEPLFYILRFLHKFSNNYGVAIIVLTLLVKGAFYPITQKSMKSMQAMSALQPKVTAIRAKWAKDKTKLNVELMNLYREEKINPMGGCLPMVLQIPFFIALFNILYTTIELRGAPFILWIQDLSAMDPYYVMPVILGISMFVQQYTQPSTMDPVQKKVMLFMPILYTFFSFQFPSGLILYWFVSNVLGILQQYLIAREDALPRRQLGPA